MDHQVVLKREEKVYLQLETLTCQIDEQSIGQQRQIGYDATTIGQCLHISRANTSKELNELFKENKLLKIKGKPVYYLHKGIMEQKLGMVFADNTFDDMSAFKDYLLHNQNKNNFPKEVIQEQNNSVFSSYIGADGSLKTQIEQAKAAILYPPNGLHTLITGSTGVGKTTFAEAMYKYGIETKIFKEDTPFVIFNCADYTDNAQLLLSHLFGHVKGAFTGADKNKEGLVSRANQGILFLDEIHRLPPEGQEMLFLIMDKGIYRKLGETDLYHTVNVRIIAATTEDPNTAVLSTFLRRIPVIIKMPDLSEFTLQERQDFIYEFFSVEAQRIGTSIKVNHELIRILMLYECNANIGQLKSNIQLICAKAFLEYIRFKQDMIIVKLSQLSSNMKDGIFKISEYRKNMTQNFNNTLVTDIVFDCSQTDQDKEPLVLQDNSLSDNFYKIIEKSWEKRVNSNLPENQILQELNNQIDNYFDTLFSKIKTKNFYYTKDVIAKIVDVKIIDIIERVLNESKLFGTDYNKKILYGLALHINALIIRLHNGYENYIDNQHKTQPKHKEEFQVATKLRSELETEFYIKIPDDEIAYLTMFLYAFREVGVRKNIGVIVVAHGDNTATGMAKVANQLLDTEHAYGIDMPLTANIKDIYEKVKEKVKEINRGKGVLLLVDMGSLLSFAQMITEETGIKTSTIDMVSTPIVIEATRKSLFLADLDIEDLTADIQKIRSEEYNNRDTPAIIEFNHNKMNDYFQDNILRILDETLSFLDSRKIYHMFDQVLTEIADGLEVEIDDCLRIKFIFHCACMIERVLRNISLEYDKTDAILETNMDMISLIKVKLSKVEEFFEICIPDTEYVFIFNIFKTLAKHI
ncbi:sigma-54-dependent transcriptional regulator [Propionispora vibrioides]|uniref:Transcriptional regulator containing an AAA-type ATPase domain and a DNA-binding domain n=1 Tax=Propionispora vibrioides TaxID=112903 RepID=A0A1H8SGY2_9FIRM|nr:sigma-54-dependent transcriptional regulator [Propionispora vibrioides]SEO78289.1 Transcriptional regulator containing an AAA-type ATPase domain and a DNA-binding domain [Propionispora vibrioides]